VQVEDVLAWRTSMEKRNLVPHTISTRLATLSASFAYFRDHGIINRNPATTKLVSRPEQPLQSPKDSSTFAVIYNSA
jgi:site-specific recombinase XerD